MKTQLIALACFFFGLPALGMPSAKFDHVITVVLENVNYSDAVQQPFLAQLASLGARFDNFHAETHPSQGNYIALTSGSLNGVKNDNPVNLQVPHIGNLLESHGLTWKVYAEDYPGSCFAGARKGNYVRKHVPFMSYLDVQKNPSACANIVNADQFDQDLQNGTLPNYVFYVPNIKNDGHDTGVAYADNWLKQKFGSLIANPAFTQNTLLIVTFDESEVSSPNNQILTILFGANTKPGVVSNANLDHYSLLRLVEDRWSLGNLGQNDATATPIEGIWN